MPEECDPGPCSSSRGNVMTNSVSGYVAGRKRRFITIPSHSFLPVRLTPRPENHMERHGVNSHSRITRKSEKAWLSPESAASNRYAHHVKSVCVCMCVYNTLRDIRMLLIG